MICFVHLVLSIQSFCFTFQLSLILASEAIPVIENPYLSILINRNDVGHSFDLGVSRQNHNLVITGQTCPHNVITPHHNFIIPEGPPAPYVGFPGTSTYYQRSYGHVTPFTAFGAYKPGYP